MATVMPTPPVEAPDELGLDLAQPRQRALREGAVRLVLLFATLVGIVVLSVLLVRIATQGSSYLSLSFLTSLPSRIDPSKAGVSPGLTGTLSLMLIVAVGSFPLGIGAALYLEEFAPNNRWTRLIETNISNLAGVPSVVYGLLGAGLFVGIMNIGRSLLAGGLTLILLILPVIIVTSREAIKAVPNELREGGMGLGATRLQATFKLVLPQALPGMITGAILGLSRAIGEAAPILVVGATSARFRNTTPLDLFDAFSALPINIYNYTFDPDPVFQGIAAGAIIVLLGALLLMNGIAIYFRNRASRGL
ncbi:MAG: phosphate transport system permease protein [Nitriliruptoraceae bacterium]|jgi:phosphate transport system permease protein